MKLIYAHDGTNSYDELFINSLRHKYDIWVLTFHPTPSYIPEEIEIIKMPDLVPTTDLYPFDGARKHILTPVRAVTFKKYVSKVKADVLIGNWATTYGVYAAYSNFHPFVLFIWGSDILVFPKFAAFKALAKYALRKADIVVVDSDVQKRAAVRLGCDSNKILAFPWFDSSRFESEVKRKSEVRKELGWSEDDIIIISMRNHNPIYGVNYLVEAIPLILRQEPKAKFLILGEDVYSNTRLTLQFKQRLKNQIVEGRVKFLGMVPHRDVVKYLSASDIYISTSLSDGTSASLLEAMTCSVPPVVTDIPANREWIQDGWNGYLIPTRNVNQLAKKIIYLAKNEEIGRETGKKALETVRAKVNWERSIETLNDAIMRCFNRVSN